MDTIFQTIQAASSSPIHLILLILLAVLFVSAHLVHTAYLSPLSAFPGPFLWALSPIPYSYHTIRGSHLGKVADLHREYGPIVRVGRRQLSFILADAWDDIYGKNNGKQLIKDPKTGPPPPKGVYGLAFVPNENDHARMRRNLAPGFSEKAVRDQEPLLQKYVDLLIEKLREQAAAGKKVDINEWLDFTVVDIIGDLTFGESFHCLETSSSHEWMLNIFKFLKAFVILGQVIRYEPFGSIFYWLKDHVKAFKDKEELHRGFINDKIDQRLAMKEEKPDFMTYVQKHTGKPSGMSLDELRETCNALILGGSETTASLLAAATYLLMMHPDKLAILQDEIRSAFKSESEITRASVAKLTYQHAVINEAMRVIPPLPLQIRRITSPEGNTIAGHFVSGNTVVAVNQWAANHSPLNFRQPDAFIPERWLGGDEFASDERKAFQPFSVGPRNCPGQILAHAEMRLILARLIWGFDLSLEKESEGWTDRLKCWAVYERVPLWVSMKVVARE